MPDPRSLFACLMAFLFLSAGSARAQEPPADGLFITVHNPITDKEVARVRELTEDAIRRYREVTKGVAKPGRFRVIYDFNPDNKESSTILHGSCSDLSSYILGLADVTTVAFVHGKVSGHTVLPVLACHEIVMASGSQLGEVMKDQTVSLPVEAEQFYKHPIVVNYQNVAERRGRSPAVILKMLAPNMEVHEGVRNGSVCYLDSRLEGKEPGVVITRKAVLPRGRSEPFNLDEALRLGLAQLRKESRQEVAEWYQLPASSLREDPLQGRTPVVWRIELRGQMTAAFQETVRRRIQRAVGEGANFIILQLECGGGSPIVARSLAEDIKNLKDTKGVLPVLTVAYVTESARDTATYLALACTHLVMDKKAQLGDFERLLEAHPNYQAVIGKELAGLASENYYSPLLAQALVDPDHAIYRARRAKGAAERRFLTEKELEESKGEWVQEGLIKPAGQVLKLDAAAAKDLGFARFVVEGADQVYQRFNVEPAQVRQSGPDWLEHVAAFLQKPAIAVILVMVGITCLVLELKLPGVGLPGVISALCFILFFWAHSQLAFTWLAVLLFLLGLVLIGMEIFVTPGMAVLGVSGILLLLSSLGLATLERWPHTESEWIDTLANVSRFGISLVAAVFIAMMVGRYLPNIPYANRLVLAPPDEQPGTASDRQQPDAHRALLGAIGVAATPLHPAGMVRFGDDFVDVVAESGYVEPGLRVQVVEIEGNRIVVKEV